MRNLVISLTRSLLIADLLVKYFINIPRSYGFTLAGKGNKRLIKWGIVSKSELHQTYDISDISVKSNITDVINNDQEEKFIRILGICGGIGSGKSLICKLLSSNPTLFPNVIRCIDSDKVAHGIYDDHNTEVLEKIRVAFGDDMIDNNKIDRKKLGQVVFSDETKMSQLEKIVWPHVRSKIESICNETIHEYQNNTLANPVIIIEGAVMIEAGWDNLFNAMWIISTNQNIQQSRLEEKRGLSSLDARKRIEFQKRNREKKLDVVDEELLLKKGVVSAVIENNGDDLEELILSLKRVWSDPNSWKKR